MRYTLRGIRLLGQLSLLSTYVTEYLTKKTAQAKTTMVRTFWIAEKTMRLVGTSVKENHRFTFLSQSSVFVITQLALTRCSFS